MIKKLPHDNWYTPTEIIEPIQFFYDGLIDVDLASCIDANSTVKAQEYYTIDNPLPDDKSFYNTKIWCNPPYCNGVVKSWIERINRLAGNGNQIIILLNRSDAKWYYDFLDTHSGGYYQLRNRVKFIDGETGERSSPRYNNDLIYWGNYPAKFRTMCYSSFGKPTPQSFFSL